jgi:glycosyltransferase involved in cell wall biosynthesis
MQLAHLVTHPIQYQAPLLRRVAADPDIQLKVFFASDLSVRKFVDAGFGRPIEWDVPLLGGYEYEFLPALRNSNNLSFWRPMNYGFAARLRAGRFDALWVHGYSRPQHWLSMLLAKRMGMKVLLRDDATLISCERGAVKLALKRVFFRTLIKIVDAFLPVGTLNRNYFLHYGAARNRIFDMPWAVDNARFQAGARSASATRENLRNLLGLERNRPIILFVGKLIERKRPADVLEAYARMVLSGDGANPYLLYIGEGKLRQQLEARAAALRLDAVKFLGFKNQSELPAFYDLCDLFVMPTVYEPWGLVVNEVMNAGRAVVISDEVGCAPDLVENGVNGLVFRARDVGDLSRVLSEVLADPVRLAQMGAKSLGRINTWSFEEDVQGLRAALGISRETI